MRSLLFSEFISLIKKKKWNFMNPAWIKSQRSEPCRATDFHLTSEKPNFRWGLTTQRLKEAVNKVNFASSCSYLASAVVDKDARGILWQFKKVVYRKRRTSFNFVRIIGVIVFLTMTFLVWHVGIPDMRNLERQNRRLRSSQKWREKILRV